MIPNFVGKGKAVSILAPYFCGECDEEHEILLDIEKDFPDKKAKTAPAQKCPKCQSALEFDDIEDKYFLFLEKLG